MAAAAVAAGADGFGHLSFSGVDALPVACWRVEGRSSETADVLVVVATSLSRGRSI